MKVKCRRLRLVEMDDYVWNEVEGPWDCLCLDYTFEPGEAWMFKEIIMNRLMELAWVE